MPISGPNPASAVPPLYRVLGDIAALWALANAGYYVLLPAFGYDLSYNSAPIVVALYFLLWAVLALVRFRELFGARTPFDWRLLRSGALSLAFAALFFLLLRGLAALPVPQVPALAPYTDLLLATPWYFLPKAVEVLVQQLLIAALVFELHGRYPRLRSVVAGYAVCFGGAHVVLFALSGAPTPYAATMTLGAVASSLLFPYLILRVRGGFVYAYAIHLLFYILLAILLHAWPLV